MSLAKSRGRRVLAAVALVVSTVAVGPVVACSPSTAPTSQAPAVPLQTGEQTTLGLGGAPVSELGVDAKNTLYLAGAGGLWTLAPGAAQPARLVFSDHSTPLALAVAPDGKVYFIDTEGIVKAVAPGSTAPDPLPFATMKVFGGIAVARDGTVYVGGADELWKLDPGATAATKLAVTGVDNPGHMAIDPDGNLFVFTHGKVVKIAKGATSAEPVPGATSTVGGLAVDGAGNLYATDRRANTVARMPAGGGDWAQLPFTGLQTPLAITVDGDGNVYIVTMPHRVVRLAAK